MNEEFDQALHETRIVLVAFAVPATGFKLPGSVKLSGLASTYPNRFQPLASPIGSPACTNPSPANAPFESVMRRGVFR